MSTDDRLERARLAYERAVFGGDDSGLPGAERDLTATEADTALARGKILHAAFLTERMREESRSGSQAPPHSPRELELFEHAARLYRTVGDVRGEGEALFWIGTFHQVIRQDHEAAVPVLERSYELADRAGDRLTVSYVLRHLAFADHSAGRLEAARERLTESMQLRRELGFAPGVAANLVGLAHIAAAAGDREEAEELLQRADVIAEACGANSVMRQVKEARATG